MANNSLGSSEQNVSGAYPDDLNLVLAMPFIHWETNAARLKQAEAIKQTTMLNRDRQDADMVGLSGLRRETFHDAYSDVDSVELATSIGADWEDGLAFIAESALSPSPSGDESGYNSGGHARTNRQKRRAKSEFLKIEALETGMDEKLIAAYLYNEHPLHIRRTLDQYYYYTLKDTDTRDADQVVSKEIKKRWGDDEKLVMMIDQLWLWVLDGGKMKLCRE